MSFPYLDAKVSNKGVEGLHDLQELGGAGCAVKDACDAPLQVWQTGQAGSQPLQGTALHA